MKALLKSTLLCIVFFTFLPSSTTACGGASQYRVFALGSTTTHLFFMEATMLRRWTEDGIQRTQSGEKKKPMFSFRCMVNIKGIPMHGADTLTLNPDTFFVEGRIGLDSLIQAQFNRYVEITAEYLDFTRAESPDYLLAPDAIAQNIIDSIHFHSRDTALLYTKDKIQRAYFFPGSMSFNIWPSLHHIRLQKVGEHNLMVISIMDPMGEKVLGTEKVPTAPTDSNNRAYILPVPHHGKVMDLVVYLE